MVVNDLTFWFEGKHVTLRWDARGSNACKERPEGFAFTPSALEIAQRSRFWIESLLLAVVSSTAIPWKLKSSFMKLDNFALLSSSNHRLLACPSRPS